MGSAIAKSLLSKALKFRRSYVFNSLLFKRSFILSETEFAVESIE